MRCPTLILGWLLALPLAFSTTSAVAQSPTAPPAPTNLTATADNASVVLTWTSGGNGGSAITQWQYVKKEGSGNFETTWTTIPGSGPTTTSYTVTGLTNGTSYQFKVRAVNAVGNGTESAPSSGVSPSLVCNRTAEIRDAIIANVSGKSTCAAITVTDLSGITTLAITEKSSLVSLKVSDFDDLTGLTRLSLQNNSLSSLPAGVFDDLTGLTQLWLHNNSLSSLPAGVFDDLTGLTNLQLNANSLSSLPAGVFDKVTGLTQLRLHNNSLSSLPAGVFDKVTGLTDLRLGGNSLSSLPAGVFDKVTGLTNLRLNGNSLSSLPAGVFDKLTGLTRLSLSENSLSSLPAGVFDKLTGLTRLWLDGNSLSSLSADVFDKLTGLTGLFLNDNSLSSLSADVFDELTGLTFLYLNDNSLNNLPAGVFDELTGLTWLNLNGNSSLTCLPFIPSSVTTLNLDNTRSTYSACGAGVTVGATSVSVEAGATKTYSLVLVAYPTGDVTVTPASSATSKATVSSALTFTQSNWSQTQSVTVTGVAAGSATVSHTVSGGGYGSATAANVAVTVSSLTASSVTAATATLTFAGHTGNWWLKRTTPADTNCKSKGTTATEDLSDLSSNTEYTYKAYSDSACTTELASETFSTVGLTADSVTRTGATLTLANWTAAWWHNKTTGPGSASCTSVAANTATASLTGLTINADYTWAVYSAANCNASDKIADVDFTTSSATLTASAVKETTATLTIDGTAAAWWYQGNQSGAQCTSVAANTATASLTGLTGGTEYTYKAYSDSACTTELTNDGSDAGFSTVGLTADSVTRTGATLTLANWTAAWWHNKTTGPGSASCTSVAANTATASLTGLTINADYTWAVYSAANCNASDKIADVDFTTSSATLTASAVKETTATLTIDGTAAAWWYQGNQSGAQCTSVAANTATASLTGLTGGTEYTYKAYSDSACTTELTNDGSDAGFSTVGLTADSVTRTGATLTLANWTAAWWHNKTTGPGSASCTSVAANTATASLTGLTINADYTWAVYSAANCNASDKIADVDFTTSSATLTASAVKETTATLTIDGTAAAWWYQGNQSGAQCTSVAANTATASLTGLTGGTEYTYKAYSDSACTTELTNDGSDAGFSTVGLTADSVTRTGATLTLANWTAAWWHNKTTGPGSASCTSVAANTATASLTGLTINADYTWAVYSAANCNASDKIADVDFTTSSATLTASAVKETTATLTIDGTAAAWWYQGNQSGAQCTSVAANTATASLTGLTGGTEYTYKAYSDSACTTELTNDGSDAGFSTVGLTADSVTRTGATLTLANWTAAWWHNKTTGPGSASCTSVAANTATASLTGLTINADYTWAVYSAANCNASDKIADVDFTTSSATLTASAVKETTATLTIDGTAAAWWYQGNQSGAQCTSVAANTATASLTGLTGGTEYTYKAYSDSACTTELTNDGSDAGFSTVGLTADSVTRTGATLTLANWTAAWWHNKTTGPGSASCTSVAANTATASLTGLTINADYTWAVYSAANCNASDKIADVDFTTSSATLTASAVKETTATLTIDGTAAAWWYQGNQSGAQCTSVAANTATASLTGLTGGTEYTYKAYSDSACTTELTNDGSDAGFSTVGLTADSVTRTGATLTLANWTAAWWHNKTTGPGSASCTSVAANTATASLTGLTINADYTWAVYSAANCNASDKIADVDFTTSSATLTASAVKETTATLTIDGTAAAWWYQGNQSGAQCTSVAANTATASLTGLTGGTEYTYKAYSDSACTTELTNDGSDAGFSTVGLTADSVTRTGATLTLANWTAAWWHNKTTGPGSASCTSVAANTATASLTGLTINADYTWAVYSAANCNASDKIADVDFTTSSATLTASAVKETTATLTIDGTAAAWWYQGNQSGAQCTSVAANTATASLTGLTGGTEYTYKAYSDSACTTELTNDGSDAGFSTVGLTADSVTRTGATLTLANWTAAWWHNKTTGPGSASCTSVAANTATASLTGLTINADYTWAVYSAANCNASDKIADVDFTTSSATLTASAVKETTATLTIDGTAAAWWYQGNQSGAQCTSVAANTATASLTGLTGGTEYTYKAYSDSACTTELTNDGSDAGFSTVGLTADSVTRTGATLTLANWTAAWWHNKTTGPGSASCTSVAANTATASLTGLTINADYTWAVYSAANCNASDKIADVDFTTSSATLTASAVKETTATLTIDGTAAAWWYQGNQSGAQCTSVAANTATASLTGLTGGTEYTYKAYSDSACTTELTNDGSDAGFSTVGLTADSVTRTGATLTLANWTAAWWHNKTTGPGSASCTSVAANTATASLTGLTINADYTWAVYSAANCNASDKIADVDFTTSSATLTASAVKETTATLTIDGTAAAWWYQGNQSGAQCTSVAANTATASLTGLTGGTEYTYKAYSDSACTTELTNDGSDAGFSTVGLTADSVTRTGATLTLANWTAAWWHNKTTGPGSASCTSVAANTATASLTGLTINADYTWAVYSAANCNASDKIADVDFTTSSATLTASAVKETTATLTIDGTAAAWWYQGNQSGAQCTSVAANTATASLTGLTGGTEYTYKAYSDSACTTELTNDGSDAGFSTVGLTADSVTRTGATLTLANWTAAWWHNKTTGPGSASCTSVAANTATASLTGLTINADYTWAVYSAANCNASDKIADVDFTTSSATLTASAVKETTATLTIDGTAAAWWYQGNQSGAQCTSVAANTATASLTGLTGGTEYTYKAYSDSACTTELTNDGSDAGFSTVGLTADSVTRTGATLTLANWTAAWWHNKTTGPGSASCTSVAANTATASLTGLTINADYTWAVYSAANCNASDKIADVDFTTSSATLTASAVKETTATLTIDGTAAAWWYQGNQSGAQCTSVAANTATASLTGLTGGTEYTYKAYSDSACTTELTNDGSDAGFSTVGLTADSVTRTGATLTLANWTAAWWHNKTTGPGSASCTSVAANTATASLTGLTINADYTWAVYSAANCNASDKIADVDFTTSSATLTASAVKETTATLTIDGTAAAWWYQGNQSGAQCTSVAANTATASLTGLTGGTEYTYKAYSDSACTTELTNDGSDAGFSTVGLTADSVTRTGATLTLANWTAAWWHNKTTGPGSASCTSVAANTATASLTGLTINADYTWAVYSAANCNASDKIADVDFTTSSATLTASAVKETTATLTIDGTAAAWWYQGNQSGAQCTSVAANTATASLTGLTGGTEYTYKAYSDSACTTELTNDGSDAGFSTVGLTADSVTRTGATLTLANWTAAWWHNKTTGPGSASCTSVAANTATASLTGLTINADYTWAVYSAANCNASDKIADVDFTTSSATLTASAVKETTATLTIDGTAAAWWYQGNQSGAQCTSVAANTATASLTGLTGGTEYTYKAYSDSACTTELTNDGSDAGFSTVGLTADSVTRTGATLTLANWTAAWWHNKTTGPGSASCTSVAANTATASLTGLTINADYTWAVYSAANCNASDKIADVDFTTSSATLTASAVKETTATLTIDGTAAAWWYQGNQSGAQCTSVAANTATASLTGLTGGTEYTYKAYSDSACTTELTNDGSDAGFSTVGLTADSVTRTGATLTLANWTAAWWHNKTTGPGSASCTSVAANTATASLTGLTINADYTWAVYSAANCNASDKIADVDFTTSSATLTASAVKETTATLTIDGTAAAWWYQGNQSGAQCTSVAANTATASLTGLTGGTEYTYKAYSDSACTTELTNDGSDAGFSTVGLTADSVTRTGATLTLANWTAAWWHNKTTGPGSASCTSVAANTATASLTGLTINADYTWAVYSAANCNASDKIADVDFTTSSATLTASAVKETTATLTIDGTAAAWWYQGNQSGAQCTSVAANTATASLTGLTGGTEYTYKAYSDSACTTELTNDGSDAGFSTVGLTADSVTRTGATLTLANWTAAWWHNKTTGPGSASCTSVAANTATASLTGLTINADYTWAVYSAANCNASDKIADVDFTTSSATLTASAVKETTATLTIDGTAAAWWYQGNQSGAQCTSVAANTATASLTGLTGGTEYTYKAYSDSACTTELTNDGSDAGFSTVGLTADSVTRTGATLTLANWTAAWWHNKTTGPGSASCTSVAANTATASLTGLTINADYTWAVYSAANCNASDKIADVDFTTSSATLTASAVKETTATLTIDGTAAAWWYQGNQSGAQCTSVAANTATASLTGLTGGTEYTYKAYSDSACTTELTNDGSDAGFSTVGLTADSVTRTGATLTLANWTAAWWHNKTTGPGSASCTSVAANTATASLTGLTINADYTWAVYSAANCNASDKIADVDFTTSSATLTASAVKETTATLTIDGTAAAWWYQGNQSGAQCTSVAANTATASLTGLTGGTEYTYKAYSDSACTTELTNDGSDAGFSTVGLTADSVTRTGATLTLANWTAAWWHNKTTGPGSASCTSVAANTATASLTGLTINADYTWAVYSAANCNASDKIADVDFTTSSATLTASAVKETTATLTIDGTAAAWWYQGNQSGAQCTSVAANTATASLTGLTGGTEYTYKAYSDSACTTELTNDGSDAGFSTVGLTADSVTRTGATLTLANWTAAWWHNKTTGPGSASCTSVAANTATASLTGLTINADYTWAVYSAANCNASDKIADVDFTTSSATLTASAVKETTATLTIDGTAAAWWYQGNQSGAQCTSVAANTATASLTGLTGGTEYTYKAYSDSACTTELTNDGSDAGFSTVGLTADSVTRTGATLTLANWTAAWWHNKTTGPGSASCTSVAANTATASLTGLTINADYTWAVYSAANCNASDKIADVDFTTSSATLTASAVKETTATLTIDGTAAAWWYQGNQSGAQCTSVAANTATASLTGLTGGTEYTYKAYSDSACTTELTNDGSDAGFSTVGLTADSVTRTGATLTLANWTAAWWHNKTTGPGSASCTSVAANTATASLTGLTINADYTWAVYSAANCNASDKIADVDFTTSSATLTASAVKETTATLTIDGTAAAWWYQGNQSGAQCTSVAANTATASLTGLTGGTEYTYKAYSDSACTTELTNDGSDAGFSTVGLTADSVTRTGATLTLANWTAAWWHNKTTGPGSASCTSVAANTATASLTGLTINADYTWAVYSAANCNASDKIADVDFTTSSATLTASAVKETTATLTIDGTAAAWWYQGNQSGAQCTSVAANTATASLTGLTGGTEYTYKAYSDSACTTELTNDGSDAGFSTVGLTADSVTRTGATLTLANWTAAWWHNKTTGPGSASCTSVAANTATASLTGLTINADYTWAVYSAANCNASDKIADVDFTTSSATLTASAVKETTATLTIDGTAAAWWYQGNQSGAQCTSVAANTATASLTGLTGGTEYTYKAYSDSACTTELTNDGSDAGFSTVGLTADSVTRTGATLTLANWTAAWWHNKTTGPGSASCTSVAANTATASLTGLTINADYTWAVYSAANCNASDKIADVDFTTSSATLTASAVKETTATLTIDGTAAAWWYQGNQSGAQCTSVAANTATASLTGLTGGTEYTYKAYSDSACTTELTNDGSDAGFSTVGLTADSVTRTGATLTLANWTAAWWHNKTTGPGSASCTSVAANTATASLTGLTINADYTWAVYSAANCNASDKIADVDFTTSSATLTASAVKETTATLTIDGTAAAWWYQGNQSGAQCTSVAANTATASLTGLTGGTEYTYKAYSDSACTTELTNDGSDAGFSTVGLTADSVTRTGATLTLANWTAAWWHNKTTGPGSASCTSVAANTATASLTGLTINADYTWAVYSAANCNASDKIADVDFTTSSATLTASAVKETTATLTIDGTAAAWWYQGNQSGAQCTSVAANTATASLTGLTGGTEYTYKAYSDSACTTELTNDGSDAGFSTVGLTADSVTRTGATLTLANWTAAWWHNKTTGPGSASCTSVAANTATASLTGLTINADYTWAVYSAANCNASDKIADVDFTTSSATLTASAVKETTATLTIDGTAAAWWYQGNQSGAQCTSVAANTATASLTGLTGGTEYTYKAYSDSACTTELTNDGSDAGFSTVGLTADSVTRTGATLTLANWTAAWWHNKTTGPGSASCTSVAANTATASLTGLTINADYTWAVYSAANCNASDKIADVDFTTAVKLVMLQPAAWLAYFGQAASGSVTQMIADRIDQSATRGSSLTIAGQPVNLNNRPIDPAKGYHGTAFGRHHIGLPGLTERQRRERDATASNYRKMAGSDILASSSFNLDSSDGREDASAGRWQTWGGGTLSSFKSDDGDRVKGNLIMAIVGTDYESDDLLLGLGLSHARGDGSFNDEGRVEADSNMTGVHPYLRYSVSDRLSVWGTFGIGDGEIELTTPGDIAKAESDFRMRTGAIGARTDLQSISKTNLTLRSDYLVTRIDSDLTEAVDAASVRSSRFRLMLGAARDYEMKGGIFRPSIEVVLRHDRGDANRGTGVGVRGNFRFTYPARRLTLQLDARGLVTHEEGNAEEWGVSGMIRIDPNTLGHGLSLSIQPKLGAKADGAQRVWETREISDLTDRESNDSSIRISADVGYGMSALGGLLTIYTGVTEAGGENRVHRLGGRYSRSNGLNSRLEVFTDGDSKGGIALQGSVNW